MGKSCITSQFIDGIFYESLCESEISEFKQKIIKVDGELRNSVDFNHIKMIVVDAPGMLKNQTMARRAIFAMPIKGIFLIYDVTNERSFISIRDFWF